MQRSQPLQASTSMTRVPRVITGAGPVMPVATRPPATPEPIRAVTDAEPGPEGLAR